MQILSLADSDVNIYSIRFNGDNGCFIEFMILSLGHSLSTPCSKICLWFRLVCLCAPDRKLAECYFDFVLFVCVHRTGNWRNVTLISSCLFVCTGPEIGGMLLWFRLVCLCAPDRKLAECYFDFVLFVCVHQTGNWRNVTLISSCLFVCTGPEIGGMLLWFRLVCLSAQDRKLAECYFDFVLFVCVHRTWNWRNVTLILYCILSIQLAYCCGQALNRPYIAQNKQENSWPMTNEMSWDDQWPMRWIHLVKKSVRCDCAQLKLNTAYKS